MYPRLRQIRENMGLPYRDVEKASYEIAVKRGRPDFILHISRLADIENRNVVPRLHKLYSLATILHVDPLHRRSRMVQRIRPPNVFRGNSQGLPLRLGSERQITPYHAAAYALSLHSRGVANTGRSRNCRKVIGVVTYLDEPCSYYPQATPEEHSDWKNKAQ